MAATLLGRTFNRTGRRDGRAGWRRPARSASRRSARFRTFPVNLLRYSSTATRSAGVRCAAHAARGVSAIGQHASCSSPLGRPDLLSQLLAQGDSIPPRQTGTVFPGNGTEICNTPRIWAPVSSTANPRRPGPAVGVDQGAVTAAARDLLPVLAGQAALGPLVLHVGQVHAEELLDRLQVGLSGCGCHLLSSCASSRPVVR